MARDESSRARRARDLMLGALVTGLELPRETLDALVETIDRVRSEETHRDPFHRDPELIASFIPLLRLINNYFGVEVRGWENVPRDEPFLVVGNHSGGASTIDPVPFMVRWLEMRGSEAPIYGLSYDLLFTYPMLNRILPRLGMLPASPDNARRALEKGAAVIVFPGGDYEVFRPWRERNKIRFGSHMGFIELAISTGVKLVPMTIHGAHESTVVLTRGHKLAMDAGFDRLKVKTFPFILNLPLGVTPAFIPSLSFPAKITVQIDPPLDWSHHGVGQAPSDEVLQACYDEITGGMQARLDAMAEERPRPILTRLNELRPSQMLLRAVRRLT